MSHPCDERVIHPSEARHCGRLYIECERLGAMTLGCSDAEAFSTTTHVLGIGIAVGKAFVEAVAREVDLRAVNDR